MVEIKIRASAVIHFEEWVTLPDEALSELRAVIADEGDVCEFLGGWLDGSNRNVFDETDMEIDAIEQGEESLL